MEAMKNSSCGNFVAPITGCCVRMCEIICHAFFFPTPPFFFWWGGIPRKSSHFLFSRSSAQKGGNKILMSVSYADDDLPEHIHDVMKGLLESDMMPTREPPTQQSAMQFQVSSQEAPTASQTFSAGAQKPELSAHALSFTPSSVPAYAMSPNGTLFIATTSPSVGLAPVSLPRAAVGARRGRGGKRGYNNAARTDYVQYPVPTFQPTSQLTFIAPVVPMTQTQPHLPAYDPLLGTAQQPSLAATAKKLNHDAKPFIPGGTIGADAPKPPPSFAETMTLMGVGQPYLDSMYTAPARTMQDPSLDDTATQGTPPMTVNALAIGSPEDFFKTGMSSGEASAPREAGDFDGKRDAARAKKSFSGADPQSFTETATPSVFAQLGLQGPRANMPPHEQSQWVWIPFNGERLQVPAPMTPDGGHPMFHGQHIHESIVHPPRFPDINLSLYYYECPLCPPDVYCGKLQRVPDLKLGGVCGDVPATAVAHLVCTITGLRIVAVDMFGNNFGRCNLWLEKPEDARELTRRIDRRMWMAPLVHGYAVVANDDDAREYLYWYLEGLRKYGPTKVRFPRHLVTAEKWEC